MSEEVISVEDDKGWYDSVIKVKKNNMKIMYKPLSKDYCNSIIREDGKFDVIIIDGKFRDKCSINAIKKIQENGIIILDNSERVSKLKEYVNAIKILKKSNLIQIDFCGFGPINDYTWSTSFFIRRNFKFKSINHPIQPVNIIGGMYNK